MIPSRHQVQANLEFRGCFFASWCWWSQCVLSWQWLWAQQNRPLKSEWINHFEGMLTSTVPCRMCENPREETIVVYKGPREMSEDTQKEGKKEKKKSEGF